MAASAGKSHSITPRTERRIGDAIGARTVQAEKGIHSIGPFTGSQQMPDAAEVSFAFFSDSADKKHGACGLERR